MAALTGNSVGSSYQSLLKTADNAAIDATLKNMTDGLGNATPLSMGSNYIQLQADTIELIEPTGGTNLIQISPTETYFEGTVNFANATVNGLPGGGGLVLGTGSATAEGAPLSMVSGSEVTTIAALARGGGDIAIGDNAKTKLAGATFPSSSIAIGHNTETTAEKAIALGRNTVTSGERGIAMGYFASATTHGTAIGVDSKATDAYGTAIGSGAGFLTGPGTEGVSIGYQSGFSAGNQSVQVGHNCTSKATNGITIGHNARVDNSAQSNAIAIGFGAGGGAAVSSTNSIAIGTSASYATGTTEAIAIGANVTASKDETLSTKNIEIQGNGNGITMYSPDGSEWLVTVTNAGALLVTTV